MEFLSVDPGETTGYVRARLEDGKLKFYPQLCGTWKGVDQLFSLTYPKVMQQSRILVPKQPPQVLAMPLFQNLDVVILEDYRVRSDKAKQHIGSRVYTIKVIGRIEWLHYLCVHMCLEQGQKPPLLAYQSASQKNQWPNRRLWRHLDPHHPARKFDPHTRDALRHLLVYLEKAGIMSFFSTEGAI